MFSQQNHGQEGWDLINYECSYFGYAYLVSSYVIVGFEGQKGKVLFLRIFLRKLNLNAYFKYLPAVVRVVTFLKESLINDIMYMMQQSHFAE